PVRLAAPNCSDVECASPHTTLADRILPDGTLVLGVAHDLLATPPAMVRTTLREMYEWRPDWLYADATHLSFFIREATRASLPLPTSCRGAVFTYTALTRVARRQISAALPSLLFAEVISMSELGWVAMECPLGTMHLNNLTFFIELVDASG